MKYGLRIDLLNEIVNQLKALNTINRLVLYGSRARGDYKDNSDIDLAIEINDKDDIYKVVDVLDQIKMIYKFDVVDLKTITNQKLIENINTDGIILYEI